jgi:hypothetical protein
MLSSTRVSLNALAFDSTCKLIEGVLNRGVNLAEAFIDALGDTTRHKARTPPACLPACMHAYLPSFLPGCLPACLPASALVGKLLSTAVHCCCCQPLLPTAAGCLAPSFLPAGAPV